MYIVPAFKEDTVVKLGQGKGGLTIMWKNGLTKYSETKLHNLTFPILN